MSHPIISSQDFLGMCAAISSFFAHNKAYMKSTNLYAILYNRTNAHIYAFETFWAMQPHEDVLLTFARLDKKDINKAQVSDALRNAVLTHRVRTDLFPRRKNHHD